MTFINVVLIVLSIIGLLLLISGFQKNKQSFILFGGIVFLAPIFWLIGWIILLPMVPPIALAIVFFTKKKERTA